MQSQNSPIQRILFGCPGTGKSHKIDNEILPALGIEKNSGNVIKTVFHPEYTYGDFMGKLVPLTDKDKVTYTFYPGHFLKALIKAYKNLIEAYDKKEEKLGDVKNVALVIDEINRGNSAAIFGTVFQLLDRHNEEDDINFKGWSSYSINLTEIEFKVFSEAINIEFFPQTQRSEDKYSLEPLTAAVLCKTFREKIKFTHIDVESKTIKLPPNLSILGTMNTSDNSIYFMDNAFKRRWDWEYIDWDDNSIPEAEYGNCGKLQWDSEWKQLVRNFNQFIKQHHNSVRGGRIEDMQIGYYFINTNPVTEEHIRNKLMFFVWDSVFSRDKSPLCDLLKINKDKLVTFGDFIHYHNEFVNGLLNYQE
jgi:5-methylcytosine-specific restriction endonuclease McrBC GTP-binding regulatory subunit McrB